MIFWQTFSKGIWICQQKLDIGRQYLYILLRAKRCSCWVWLTCLLKWDQQWILIICHIRIMDIIMYDLTAPSESKWGLNIYTYIYSIYIYYIYIYIYIYTVYIYILWYISFWSMCVNLQAQPTWLHPPDGSKFYKKQWMQKNTIRVYNKITDTQLNIDQVVSTLFMQISQKHFTTKKKEKKKKAFVSF